MSATQMEPIDEFAPASPGIEEGRYLLQYQKAFETNGQYGKQNVHILELVEVEGETIRVYCDPKMSKGSQQRNLLEAFLGREIAEGEQVTPRMVRGKQAYGDVEMNKNDKPKVVKFSKARQLVTAAAAETPVPAPIRPVPPPRPVAAPSLRTDEQRDEILRLASESEYDTPTLTNWIAQSYPGKGIDTITPVEADELIKALAIPF